MSGLSSLCQWHLLQTQKAKTLKLDRNTCLSSFCPTVGTPQYLLPSSLRQRRLCLKRPRFGADIFTLYFYRRKQHRYRHLSFKFIYLRPSPYFQEVTFSHPSPDVLFQGQPPAKHSSSEPIQAPVPWPRPLLTGGEPGGLLVAVSPGVVWRNTLTTKPIKRKEQEEEISVTLSLRPGCPWWGNIHEPISCSSSLSYGKSGFCLLQSGILTPTL